MMLIGNKTDLDYKYRVLFYRCIDVRYRMMKDLIWLRKMGCYLWNVLQNLGKMLMHYFQY